METVPSHEIVVIDPSSAQDEREALRQQCYDVRIDVFHHEQGFPLDTELDHLEDSSTHFLLRLVPSLKPVGTIRYTKFEDYSKLSRLAVLKEYRQHKFGRELVSAIHNYAIQNARNLLGVLRIVCHSQIPVKAFYEKLGYGPEGEEFDEDGAPHQRMVVSFPLSPPS